MIDEKVINYIKYAKSISESDAKIINDLRSGGWSEEIISEAFTRANNLVVESPVNNTSAQNPSTVNQVNPVISNGAQNTSVKVKNVEINSSFSVLLAAILTVSLFILSNKIFADAKLLAGDNVTKLLMVQGLFVIPFIAVAFLLNASLKDGGERYKIISTPYFIISGILLLRLLFKVAGHILDKNAALGVYIVLGMVIIVLTGIILFVSHYVKNK